MLAALEVLPEPHRSMIRTLVDVCAYAGTSQCIPLSYKKFQLMLTRRVKAYSSSCSQIASVYLQPFRCSSLLKCAVQPKIAKKTMKPIIFGVQSLSKSSMLIQLKSSSLGLVVIGSMPMPICNRFYERLADNSKITTFTTFTEVLLFDALVHRFF